MREIIEETLETFADLQPNMASKAAREIIATAIEKALLMAIAGDQLQVSTFSKKGKDK
jgi:hypothetical protein